MLEEMKSRTSKRDGREPTQWTRPLQLLTAACAVAFTMGTVLNVFVVTPDVVEHSMRLSGMGTAEAANATESFYTVYLVVGILYIIGNALGVLALRGWAWVFWLAVVVNLTQGFGVLGAVPPEIFQALEAKYGTIGVVPTLIVDGGGLILAIILIGSFVKFRTAWAREK